jgi:hypothetical protein
MEIQKPTRIKASDFAFYMVAIGLVIVLGKITIYLDTRPYVAPTATVPDALSKAQDAHANVGNLLTTLATGLFAAFGVYLTRTAKHRLSTGQLWRAALSVFFIFVSLYFGYMASQNLVWAIESSVGTLDLPKLQWPRWLQFYSLISSVFCFADFVRRDLSASD